MTPDEYVLGILKKHEVDRTSAVRATNEIRPLLQSWGGEHLKDVQLSGSLAKGTGVSLGTDADLFLSLSSTTPYTLKEIYTNLYDYMTAEGITPRKQNVSIGITYKGCSIDLVPGRRQSQFGNDHSLYRSKADSWTKTNVAAHVSLIQGSGRIDEIRALKIWRARHGLSIPSFLLELATITALTGARRGNLANNVLTTIAYLETSIKTVCLIDPANTNNVVSDDCTAHEKSMISAQACESRLKPKWDQIVW